MHFLHIFALSLIENMLKYKRKRIIRYTIAVIVPILIITAVSLVLHYTNRVDLSEIDLISTTQDLFNDKDTLAEKHDKMSAKNTNQADSFPNDTTNADNTNDSIALSLLTIDHFEGKSIAQYVKTDSIDLKKDVLIATKQYSIPVDLRDKQLDSLLMNRTNLPKILDFTIEFWQSPVNFKGYKRSANKAIIFGITDIDNCELYIDNRQYYLILNSQLFLLESSDVFKKFIAITL